MCHLLTLLPAALLHVHPFMSAKAIAAARHQRQDHRLIGTQPDSSVGATLPPATAGIQDVGLRKALLGSALPRREDGLLLPQTSTFEPIVPQPMDVPLTGHGKQEFARHTVYYLPRETAPDQEDVVHCFSLRDAGVMNDGIYNWALRKEAKFEAARAGILLRTGVPSQFKDLGKVVSNRGGYQSHPDLFERQQSNPAQAATRRFAVPGLPTVPTDVQDAVGLVHCHELHRIASEALEQLGRDRELTQPVSELGEQHRTRFLPATSWLNVNRAADVNMLHIHNKEKLSGTYYVTSGQRTEPQRPQPWLGGGAAEAGGGSCDADSCLIFRTGAMPRADGGASDTTHTFMKVAPVPGELWLFPGSIPHMVMGVSPPHMVMGVSPTTQPSGAAGLPDGAPDGATGCDVFGEPPFPGTLAEMLLTRAPSKLGAPTLAEWQAGRRLWRPRISIAMNFEVRVPVK